MPDRFLLPPGGPQPYDERDLDSLLAGKTSDVPVALRPVADTLNALRAGPTPRELHGEARARAAFSNPWAETPAALPPARRRAPYHRTRGWLAGLATAAAVVLAVTVTYTGNLPAPAQQLAHDTIAAPPARNHPPATAPAGPTVSSVRPTPVVTYPAAGSPPARPGTSAAPDREALCEAFRATWQHPQTDKRAHRWRTEQYQRLSAAAGGPQQVNAYCAPVWHRGQSGHHPRPPASPTYSSPQPSSSSPPPTPAPTQSGSGTYSSGTQQGGGSPTTDAGQASPGAKAKAKAKDG
ncbi:MAG: hypothetical protein J2P26_08980 [Nocardiopsaceae bacterium]|nr:hypothetical protein [Nocardiopsaceae bacterium]